MQNSSASTKGEYSNKLDRVQAHSLFGVWVWIMCYQGCILDGIWELAEGGTFGLAIALEARRCVLIEPTVLGDVILWS